MALSPELTEQFNKDVQNWAKLTKQKLFFRLASLSLESQIELLDRVRGGRKPLSESLRSYVKKEFGQAEIVRFSFWLHGFFFDRGVGKGLPIESAGSSTRIPKPWIDYVLEDEVERLADIIIETYGDEVVDTIKFKK